MTPWGADERYRVCRCGIHIHTTLSDGELPIEEIVPLADACGLDALLLTDHHAATPRERRWEGTHGNVFVIEGDELSTDSGDHLIAFGLHDRVNTRRLPVAGALKLLKELGAVVFVAHPQGRPSFRRMMALRYAFDAWQEKSYDGLEAWSYMHDWIEHLTPFRLADMCRHPDRYVTGPDREVLTRWDYAAQDRPVAIIGGLDTHGRYLPLGLGRLFSWARKGILPYEQNFKAMGHYALVESGENDEDDVMRKALLSSLGGGHGWVAHDSLHSGREAIFAARTKEAVFAPGAAIPFEEKPVLEARLPLRATVRLCARGKTLREETTDRLEHPVENEGEYRFEVELDGRFWILTNHFRIAATPRRRFGA